MEGNALGWLDETFASYIEDRRREPRDDVLTRLAQGTYPDGSVPEITSVVRTATFLFAAGQETTARLLAVALKYLCEYPELQDELRAHPERIPDFIDEALRIESPVKADFRLSRRATTVAGVDIAAGTPVMLLNGAANRDPRHFDAPGRVPAGPSQRQGPHRLRAWRPLVPRRPPGPRRGSGQHRAHPRPHAGHPALRGTPRAAGGPPLRLRADLGPARAPQAAHRVHPGRGDPVSPRVAVVTGAASGIGLGIARRLAATASRWRSSTTAATSSVRPRQTSRARA